MYASETGVGCTCFWEVSCFLRGGGGLLLEFYGICNVQISAKFLLNLQNYIFTILKDTRTFIALKLGQKRCQKLQR